MFEALKEIDQRLLVWGNSFHTDFMDGIMFHLTEFWWWIPLFSWWIFELYKIYRKKLLTILIYAVIMVITVDQLTNLIKNMVKRFRPTHNLMLQNKIHIVNNYYGGPYGYLSSHAANVFAVAVFIFFLTQSIHNKVFKASLFIWALFICYTRIYLGVHYPFDLFSGAIFGAFMAYLFYKIIYKFNL